MSPDLRQSLLSLLKARNMKYADLANLTNISIHAIRRIGSGHNKTPKHLDKIAKALGVDVETLSFSQADQRIIDIEKYTLIVEIINKVLKQYGITSVPNALLQDYIEGIYKDILDSISTTAAESYLKGKIDTQLKFGIIKSSS